MPTRVLLLLALSLAWAAGYLFEGEMAQRLPPLTATAAMCAIAGVVMLPAVPLLLRRPLLQPLRRRLWVPLVMALSAVALPNLAVVAAERSVPPDLAAILGTTVPIATLIITTFITRETRLSAVRLLGVGVALAGMVIFVGPGGLGAGAEVVGVLVMVAGGLVFAANGVLVGRQTEDLDSAALAAWTMVFAAPVLAAAAFLFERPLDADWSAPALLPLLAEGLVGLAFAYLAYYALVAQAGAWFASLYAFLVPPLGVLLSAASRGEWPTLNHVLGVGVVVAGLFLLGRKGRPTPAAPKAAG